VWAIVFITGWKRIEQTYQYEWDTMTYEEVSPPTLRERVLY